MDKQITEGRIYTEGVNNGYNKAIEEFENMIKHSLYTNDDGETYIVKSLLIKQLQKMKEKKCQ